MSRDAAQRTPLFPREEPDILPSPPHGTKHRTKKPERFRAPAFLISGKDTARRLRPYRGIFMPQLPFRESSGELYILMVA